jgi:hypothetical protein
VSAILRSRLPQIIAELTPRVEQRRRRGELSADDQAALAVGRVVTIE